MAHGEPDRCGRPDDDPRQAATLGEAAQNPDGSWNALKALSFLSEALNPGRGIPLDEVTAMAEAIRKTKENKDG